MHDSVMHWALGVLDPVHVHDRDVLEVGSLDVNGSLRSPVVNMLPRTYKGIDIRPGPGVDVVGDAEQLPAEVADLIISTEMLEHAKRWRHVLAGMVRALRPGGLLLLTTRGPGFGRHDHPGDYWRFTPPMMSEILVLGLGLALHDLRADPDYPGVFALAAKPAAPELHALMRCDVLTVDGHRMTAAAV